MREKDVMKIQNIREEMKGLQQIFPVCGFWRQRNAGEKLPAGRWKKKETAQDWNFWKQKHIM